MGLKYEIDITWTKGFIALSTLAVLCMTIYFNYSKNNIGEIKDIMGKPREEELTYEGSGKKRWRWFLNFWYKID